jgi:hypothetical protein
MTDIVELAEQIAELDDPEQQQYEEWGEQRELDQAGAALVPLISFEHQAPKSSPYTYM